MQLEALKRRVRIEQRILVAEADDEADRDAAAGHRVEKAAAELFLAQRVAERVDHGAGLQPIGWDFPDFLQADGELRRVRLARRAAAARLSSLVRLPRTPSAKIVTLATMSAPGSNVPFCSP